MVILESILTEIYLLGYRITIKQKEPKRRLKRQTSVQSEATNSYRVSRKPSIISVFQRVFNKDGPTVNHISRIVSKHDPRRI